MSKDRLYLTHMSECIARIQQYVAEGRSAFERSTLVQDGVLRNLQVLAESSQRVSEQLKREHPEIDWRGMAGFRNVLVHDYLNIDLDIVWNVIERDLPDLKKKTDVILQTLREQSEN
ncbi:MAG: DUF86 domain-containing protein [Chloroflexota bacterium]